MMGVMELEMHLFMVILVEVDREQWVRMVPLVVEVVMVALVPVMPLMEPQLFMQVGAVDPKVVLLFQVK
tara:strand:- start:142 stop:348 length:207 start_codon:yes stop_codon:yes gene_type:complete